MLPEHKDLGMKSTSNKITALTDIDENRTIDELGKEIVMPFKDLKHRIRALIMRSDVDSIAIIESEQSFV